MTNNSLKSISPDGITGMIFALEGMKNTVVLLNGPMGCRFYHSTTSRFLTIRPLLYVPGGEGGEKVPVDYNYLNDWFFRQERVPCTYLDGYDYVYGTREKIREALEFLKENIAFELLAIVNSPGAALIGDNLLDLARKVLGSRRVVMLESPGYSTSFQEGYSLASLELLRQAGVAIWQGRTKRKHPMRRVNLLGLSLWNRYFEGDLAELRRLLGLCGIEVNAALCADCSLNELSALPDADLDLAIYPEMGLASARFLEEKLGIPMLVCDAPPVGFSATETLFREICRRLELSPEPVLEESRRARALAWYRINDIHRAYGKPRGVTFFVRAMPSLEKAYTEFLRDYLGMEPAGAREAELVFSDANVISELMLENKTFCGIEIALPGMGYLDLVPKTHLGTRGSLFLIEQVLNGLMSNLS